MWDTNWGKFPHIFYNLNIVRKKSWKKYQKAIERYIDILKKEEKAWESKRTIKTKEKALARLKKYGIKNETVVKFLDRKWLKDLVSKVSV